MGRFPVIVEREASGVFSAYVAGLPVYAQGATARSAEVAITRTLQAYLTAHPDTPGSRVRVRVAVVTGGRVQLKSPAAWVGGATSARKAQAARRNGRLGGRPRL